MTSGDRAELSGVGVWSVPLRYGATDEVIDAAAEPGATRTPSAAASGNTTTPALITYASRPSPTTRPLSLGRPGAA